MRAVIQRVKRAAVRIDGRSVGEIESGMLILLGIRNGDTESDARYIAEKCVNLRIFNDQDGKINLSALDVGGQLLIVSQFTLYGDCRKGRRPSFINAAPPHVSEPIYEYFVERISGYGLRTATGEFGAAMTVEIHNDGPVTVIVDSD